MACHGPLGFMAKSPSVEENTWVGGEAHRCHMLAVTGLTINVLYYYVHFVDCVGHEIFNVKFTSLFSNWFQLG
jgi:hypothetical protein